MKKYRYAARPAGDDEWKWVTTFYRVGHMWCSSPKAEEGHLNTLEYRFKRLTEAEYESYLEMEVLRERDSDEFVIRGVSDEHWEQLRSDQACFELHELDDVFNQPE